MVRVKRFEADAPTTFKAATALTSDGNVRHVDHIAAGALNPFNGAVRILHETDVVQHSHPSRRQTKSFEVDGFLPALRAYLSGEGDDFVKAETPAIIPSHGSIVGVMAVTTPAGKQLQGRQIRFFLYISHHKDDAAALEDTILDHHHNLSELYVEDLHLAGEKVSFSE